MRISLIALTIIILSGCNSATVTERQCIASDWQTLGYRDGSNGVTSSQLLKHQDACVKHGIIPDRSDYMLGWEQGVREFCQPENGFITGERGHRYDNVCPTDQKDVFLAAYREGRRLYEVRSEVAALERLIQRKEQRLVYVKREIVASGTAQLNEDLTTAERVELLALTQRLIDERSVLEAEIPQLIANLAYKENELAALRRTLAGINY